MLLKAQKREITGKKVASLRKQGLVPAVLYGWSIDGGHPISLDVKDFEKTWREAGESTILELEIDGEKKNALIYGVERDPLKGGILHVDFYAPRMDKTIETEVPIVFEGESPAAKAGAAIVKVMHELLVEALPADLPHEIKVDISSLQRMGDRITVADLRLGDKVKTKTSSEDVIILAEEAEKEEAGPERSIEDIEVEKKGKKEEEVAGEEAVEA